MQIPLEIEFRNMERSPAMEMRIQELVAHLERFGVPIIRCHVALEAPHRHQRQGKLFEATLRITAPGREIVVDNPHPQDHAHEDPYVAVRDAFRAAQRQLQDHARIQRGDVKTHATRSRDQGGES
jgi:ribosome-associated translation inhibitor RaiA